MDSRSRIVKFLSGLIMFLFGFSLWAFTVEPDTLIINNMALQVPHWNNNLESLKIGVLADIHAGSPFIDEKKLDKIVELTNKEKPDIIFLLGDYVVQDVIGGKFIPPEIIAQKLSKLKAPYGIIAILGNHDWWLDGIRVKNDLEKYNITVLENNAIHIDKNGKSFWVAGLADLWTRKPDINKTLSFVTNNDPIILLTHNPHTFDKVPSRVSITLAGHNHGCGQLSFGYWGKIGLPFLDGKYHSPNYIVEQGRRLFISSGIGTSEVPIRFGTLPEIVIMQIKTKS